MSLIGIYLIYGFIEYIKKNEEYDNNQTDLVVYKEPGFIKKFFNLIKGIFKKNKF